MADSCVQAIDILIFGRPPTAYGNVNVVDIGTHKLINIAGQLPILNDGTIPEDIWDQFDACFFNINAALETVGQQFTI